MSNRREEVLAKRFRGRSSLQHDVPQNADPVKPWTLFFASSVRHELDDAFEDAKQALRQHGVRPRLIDKGTFYSALLRVGLAHLTEVIDEVHTRATTKET